MNTLPQIDEKSPPSGLPQPPENGDARGRFADFLHQSLNHNIAMADRKSGIVFTLVVAVLVFLLQSRPPGLMGAEGIYVFALWVGSLTALLVSGGCAFGVVFPRLRRERSSLLYWASVARHETASSYEAQVGQASADQLNREKLTLCYALARICQSKYRLLRVAMQMAAAGLAGFLVASVLGLG